MSWFRSKKPNPVKDWVFCLYQRVYVEGADRGEIIARRVVNGWIESVTVRLVDSSVVNVAPQALRAL